MARVLVTGMSGAGKSTLLDEMRRRGRSAVDTDYDGWTLADGTWDEPRMAALLAAHADLVVAGAVPNQGRFYHRFHHVVLLSAPLPVLLQRVADRANPYGRTPEQRAEIAEYVRTVEPLLRRGAGTELDGRRAVADLADALEELVREAP
ncbi:AAA family ATPase [Actinoplanes awajinensis]|uniref:ATP-binding protein n=1 Tax=Actinoplanes awajinensis subsp. mycoplanecinus TaxID=135947 RepID=A0A0X3V4E0_9ACTN|nr:AAA family ATPase [Actinoplanes awajinensis]KUL39659.1 ATP-binding protein [Actinoplanes awajinensis subsp. mycoplanecinus]